VTDKVKIKNMKKIKLYLQKRESNFQKLGLLYREGFTLIELLVTIVILTVGIISIVRSFLSVSQALSKTLNTFYAVKYLDEKMANFQEEILNNSELNEDSGEFITENRKFNWNLKIKDIDEKEDLKEICLNLTWMEANSQKKLTLSTLFKKIER